MKAKFYSIFTLFFCFLSYAQPPGIAEYTAIKVPGNKLFVVEAVGYPPNVYPENQGAHNCHAYSLYISQGGVYDPTYTGHSVFWIGDGAGGWPEAPIGNNGYCEKYTPYVTGTQNFDEETEWEFASVQYFLDNYFTDVTNQTKQNGDVVIFWQEASDGSGLLAANHSFVKTGSDKYSQVPGLNAKVEHNKTYNEIYNGWASLTDQVKWYRKKSWVNFNQSVSWKAQIIGCQNYTAPTSSLSNAVIQGPSNMSSGEEKPFSSSVNVNNYVGFEWSTNNFLTIESGANSSTVNVAAFGSSGSTGQLKLLYRKEWLIPLKNTTKNVEIFNCIGESNNYQIGASTATPCPGVPLVVTLLGPGPTNIVWSTHGDGTQIVSTSGNQVTVTPGPYSWSVTVNFESNNGCSVQKSDGFTTYFCN